MSEEIKLLEDLQLQMILTYYWENDKLFDLILEQRQKINELIEAWNKRTGGEG